MIKQSKPLKIKRKILSNLFNEKYGVKLGEFNNTTGTERVKVPVYTFEGVLHNEQSNESVLHQIPSKTIHQIKTYRAGFWNKIYTQKILNQNEIF